MSLARLCKIQDKKPEARELPFGAYGWFPKGSGIPHLVDAKAILEELSQRSKASDLLDEPLATSSELGMRPLMERCCPGERLWGRRSCLVLTTPTYRWYKSFLQGRFPLTM